MLDSGIHSNAGRKPASPFRHLLTWLLVGLILLLQYPLWWGKGNWRQLQEAERALQAQQAANRVLQTRNEALIAEFLNMKAHPEEVKEDVARLEFGLMKEGEVFFLLKDSTLPTK